MRIKKGYILRQVNNEWIVVSIGAESINFNGLIRLNETGAFLFKILEDNISINELAEALANEYEVDLEKAEKDCLKFINILKDKKILDESN